jgi:hypothetical protein
MLRNAPEEIVRAKLGSVAGDWIVEPARLPGGIRLRNTKDPAFQMALMPAGTTLREDALGHSSLQIEKQRLLLAAAERASLWDLQLGSREESIALINSCVDFGWLGLAAEIGRSGRRSGEWIDIPQDRIADELADPRNWVAGPYPSEGAFVEIFLLLTPKAVELVRRGAADDAIKEDFATRPGS